MKLLCIVIISKIFGLKKLKIKQNQKKTKSKISKETCLKKYGKGGNGGNDHNWR